MSALNNSPLLGASGQQGYFLNRSVRLRSSATAYFNRTFTTPTNNTVWSWSGWVKIGQLGTTRIFLGGSGTNYGSFGFENTDQIRFWNNAGSGVATSTAVFRDPSAWYHVVVISNGTTIKAYVNNAEVLSYTGTITNINSAIAHNIGRFGSIAYYLDGYLTEINFVDGQALTTTSFGEYNTITGVWQPKKYGGTYGTNGFYLPFNLQNTSSYAASFNGSTQYLYLNGQSAFTFGANNFTIESWVYSTSASQTSVIYDGRPIGGTQGAYPTIYLNSGVITYFANNANLITGISLPVNQWTHVAIVRSGVTTTMYVNGVSQGSATDSTNYLSGGANRPVIAIASAGTNLFSGSLSNFRIVNGTAVYTSNFVPSSVPLTAITNTALLTLQNATIVDNSTNAFTISNNGSVTTSLATPFVSSIGADASGNNNNWNANNINVATVGTTFDSMTDVPTLTSATQANYCTLNPLNKNASSITVLDGNLGISTTATNVGVAGTIGMSTGKWYWETTFTNASGVPSIGAAPATWNKTYVGEGTGGVGYHGNGVIYKNGTNVQSGLASYTSGDVIGVALDMGVGSITFYKNNVQQGTTVTGLTGEWFPAVAGQTSSTLASNFGQRPFTYTPPTGFKSLNTYNLPAPTIPNGAAYMAASLYTGNASTQSITNTVNSVSFQPDLAWIKVRSITGQHVLTDSIRGVDKQLFSSLTNAEQTSSGGITSFNSNGFGLGSGVSPTGSTNENSQTYVAWQWKASNAAPVTNTSGSITSSVSANPSAGFSIVTYTGNGSANQTIGHGLGVAPKMAIIKGRSNVFGWGVQHIGLTGGNNYLALNTTAAQATDNTQGSISNANSTTLQISGSGGASSWANANAATYVAYCFSEIAGYSKFGSYTGNGSADGPFVYCGFRPRFVLIKSSTEVANWFIRDTSRDTYNAAVNTLYPNLSDAEFVSSAPYDILSNGFKVRASSSGLNTSGQTYIFAVFAENPFNYSLAR